MNRTSLWIVMMVTAAWIGFLMGYSVSSHTGGAKPAADRPQAAESAGAGGYGK